ncbi:MAG: hypothetical protein IJM55_02885 [Ruminococcus sp.]|nr:hypothetical protein [Ruminococcus sp.]
MTMTRKRTLFRRILLLVLAGVGSFVLLTVCGIYFYLYRFGYGLRELPKTLAVFCHLSDGFTVEERQYGDRAYTVYIGRNDSEHYTDLMEEKGYEETDRRGAVGVYSIPAEGSDTSFSIAETLEWCFWFRLYEIDNGYRIEDFE